MRKRGYAMLGLPIWLVAAASLTLAGLSVAGLSVAGLSVAGAWAAEPVSLDLVISNHRFQPAELHVPAGQSAVIHVRNVDATAEEFDSPALKVEKVFAGASEGVVRLHPLEPGRYVFQGEYHPDTAQGVVIAQ